MKPSRHIILMAFGLLLVSGTSAQLTLSTFATGLNAPIDLKSCGDDRIFVVQQGGRIRIIDTNGVVRPNDFLNITSRVNYGGERGFLSMEFDQDYQNNGYFYVNYTHTGDNRSYTSRFSVSPTNPDSADPNSEVVLLNIWDPFSNHNGCQLQVGPNDGYLYISLGDGGGSNDPDENGQNLDSLWGKLLRIDGRTTPYSIPPDNPFVGTGAREEIWAYGLRNPWRWSFDRWNGDMWIGDVGQNAWEELNYRPASSSGGENYGWDCYEGLVHTPGQPICSPTDTVNPYLVKSHGIGVIAIIGGYVYRGAKFSNLWGKYFYTDQSTGAIGIRMVTRQGTSFYDSAGVSVSGTIVSFGQDKWGELYAVDIGSGTVYHLEGNACAPVAAINEGGTIYVCDTVNPYVLRTPDGNGFHYEWFRDGNSVGNDNDTLLITQGGVYSVTAFADSLCNATSANVTVIYSGPPAVSFSGLDTFYCVYHDQDTLTGLPLGGEFSGPGLSGPINRFFNPAAAGAGDHTIAYSYTDPVTGCTGNATQLVHVDLCTQISEQYVIQGLRIYPNPNEGSFALNFYSLQKENVMVEITDATGRIVHKELYPAEPGNQVVRLELKTLSPGTYFLKVRDSKGSTGKYFIVE